MNVLFESEGGPKGLSIRSGLSQPTLRKIADTGVASSHATAAKLASASGGTIDVDDALGPDARGGIYKEDPGHAILTIALRDKVSVTEVLGRIGLDHGDLWDYMNHGPDRQSNRRDRVRTALENAGIPDPRRDAEGAAA
jgi:hypothetical protein